MRKEINYTSFAQQFSGNFPAVSFISIQVAFWCLANILLVAIMQLYALSITETLNLPKLTRSTPSFLVAVILGIVYGTMTGIVDYCMRKTMIGKQSLGTILITKVLTSVIILTLLFVLIRFVLFGFIAATPANGYSFSFNSESWKYLFLILVIYYFIMAIANSFINQMNEKYGPGVLIPLLLGKYRTPHEEERIFMFMDLKSSTTKAEEMGHLKYSAFIRDCFIDINQLLLPFNAAVYQYVGDEIVISWGVKDGIRSLACVKFFFGCEKIFSNKAAYYMKHYGFLPEFKAGLHMGIITAVEIGDVKRDIAYHGDTLNTTARIQGVCNEYRKKILVSGYLHEMIGLNNHFKTENLGMIKLKGKSTAVEILSVEEKF